MQKLIFIVKSSETIFFFFDTIKYQVRQFYDLTL